ncbi:hypothetical protein M407DRAFT_245723 [Tulasnella calospora MUT 4182]|uniref:HNH nuclease domain-containing protein n=1 Tax=Tulasnella calospora MUT 4182 TaxID=1051891 RepID=A0A0C3LGQ5_9AGAM|nr:hypothetical protein M407DRAFT_245723 [Tulasnella calospora MUT 4182]
MALEQLLTMIPLKLAQYHPRNDTDRTLPLLRALLRYAPTENGRKEVAINILRCSNDKLGNLGDHYLSDLLVPIRAMGGRTPTVSAGNPSNPDSVETALNVIRLEPQNFNRQRMRILVLAREDYRCIVSGHCDFEAFNQGRTTMTESETYADVHNAHILPFSLVGGANATHAEIMKSASVWQVIEAFSGISLDDLNGNLINRPENGITLDSIIHKEFGRLSLCFVATEVAHTYKVQNWNPKLRDIPKTVTFVPRAEVPLPDPRYLALHAACANVVHASGMAEILDRAFDDLESMPTLSNDGSSAYVLQHALATIMVR